MIFLPKEKIQILPTMILSTGSNPRRRRSDRVGRIRGITFIEVMLTVVILSVGLVAIYRSFFSAVNYLDHLSTRLYALNLMESRMATIEKDFRSLKDFDIGPLQEEALINNHPVLFRYTVDFKPVGTLLSVFELDVVLSWDERGREVSVARTAYFSGVTSLAPSPGKGA
jgi:hypothetical protein